MRLPVAARLDDDDPPKHRASFFGVGKKVDPPYRLVDVGGTNGPRNRGWRIKQAKGSSCRKRVPTICQDGDGDSTDDDSSTSSSNFRLPKDSPSGGGDDDDDDDDRSSVSGKDVKDTPEPREMNPFNVIRP